MQKHRPAPSLAVFLGLVLGLPVALAGSARAADWYVAPLDAPPSGVASSGSEAAPFATVSAAIKSGKVKGGDRILLKDGPHGKLLLENVTFDSPVTIMSQHEKAAQLDSVLIRSGSSNIRLLNLSVWPTDPSSAPAWLVQTGKSTSDITVEGLVVRTEPGGIEKFAAWDEAKWEARKFSGISLGGLRNAAVQNDLMGIAFGISLTGDESRAVENVIEFYNGDGLRGLGDNNVFLRNRVSNCIKTDGNHADGFQSFAGESGSVKGLVLDSNTIIEWTHPDGDHPLRCSLQGIGLFDGFYDDLTIINNLVTTTQYHGISVLGARNAIISNNTVANTDGVTGPHPYLSVRNHKDGSLTTGVLVANNLAMSFTGSSDPGSAVEYRNNSVIGTPGAVFENPFAQDYRPKATSGFIDSGDAASAPAKDLLGNARPVGKGPDRGAIEVGGTTQPAPPEENEEIVAEGPTTEEPAVTTPEVKDPVVTEPVVTKPVVTKPVVTKPVVTKPAVNKRPRRSVSRWISESLNGVYKRARVRLSSR